MKVGQENPNLRLSGTYNVLEWLATIVLIFLLKLILLKKLLLTQLVGS